MLPSSPDFLCLEDPLKACSAMQEQAVSKGHTLQLNFHPKVYWSHWFLVERPYYKGQPSHKHFQTWASKMNWIWQLGIYVLSSWQRPPRNPSTGTREPHQCGLSLSSIKPENQPNQERVWQNSSDTTTHTATYRVLCCRAVCTWSTVSVFTVGYSQAHLELCL